MNKIVKRIGCLLLSALLLLPVSVFAAGEDVDQVVPFAGDGSSAENPLPMNGYFCDYILPGQTLWFLYDNYSQMVNDGVDTMVLAISSDAHYSASYSGVDVPVDENGFASYEMHDLDMQGKYLFCVTNMGTNESFFTIEVKHRPAYTVSDRILVIGDNPVFCDPDYANTLYEFIPSETGVYTFTVADGVIGNWCSIFNPMDLTQNKGTALEWTCTAVGQSVLVGVAQTSATVLRVEKTGGYTPAYLPEWEYYKCTYDFSYELPDGFRLAAVGIPDRSAFLDEQGFYRYGSKQGPLLVMDLNEFPLSLKEAAANGQLRAYLYDENGELQSRVDYNDAFAVYLEAGLTPVTEELVQMLRQVGDFREWWDSYGFLFEEEAPVGPEIAWMMFCSYVPETGLDLLMGDVNQDGKCDIGDVARLYAHVRNVDPLSDGALECADVNGDGKCNTGDTAWLYARIRTGVPRGT